MKKLLKEAAVFLGGIVATVVVTRIITGESLSGLVKLRELYRTFIQSTVPAWAFAAVFLIALSGIYYASTHPPKGWAKGKVHFVPDAHNTGWARRSEILMDVRGGGTLTYEGRGDLTLVKAFLKGTQPVTDMNATMPGWGGGPVTLPEIFLRPHVPTAAVIQVYVRPVLGIPGGALRSKLVLRDAYNRDFVIGPIEFPCLGMKRGA